MSHIVKHQGPYSTFAWRVPENSTTADTVLHVRESEEAIAVNENSIIGLFPCGEYELNKEKTELVDSTIYFINKDSWRQSSGEAAN